MQKNHRTLLGTITDRASEIFPFKVDKNNWEEIYPIWTEHWFRVALDFRNELHAEGLTQTVAKIDRLIYEMQKMHF
jgi:hypothetical protein